MKLRIKILTFFPDFYTSYKLTSFAKKYIADALLEISIYNLIELSEQLNMKIDAKCYGIDGGIVMRFDTIFQIYGRFFNNELILLPCPTGPVMTHQYIYNLLQKNRDILIICPRYDGIDHRAVEHMNMNRLSIGDYILSDGDTAALVIMNVMFRLSFSKDRSIAQDSLTNNLLESPQYTRPVSYNNLTVPDILRSGNHQEIRKWQHTVSLARTKKDRPDLIK